MATQDNSGNIFVVDDSRTVRDQVAYLLETLSCRPVLLPGGQECLAELERGRPLLVLMDLEMDPMRGDECCRYVKGAAPDVPVVMMTGNDAPDEVLSSWWAGADDFLPKPVDAAQLGAKIEAVRQGTTAEPTRPDTQAIRKVLYLEHNRFDRQMLGSMLEHAGFHLIYAQNGTQARELSASNGTGIDAFLLDLAGPDVDNVAMLDTIARSASPGRPILVVSEREQPGWILTAVERLTGKSVIDKRAAAAETIISRLCSALSRPQADLRVAERVSFCSVVHFRADASTSWFSGFSYNLSTGGIFVRTLTPLPVGTQVDMKVHWGTEPQVFPDCVGEVAWANPYRARRSYSYPLGMGIRFSRLDPEQRRHVAALVTHGPRV